MLGQTGRHPWRPAHVHMIVSAPGLRTVTTHIFDSESDYLDADAVFAVKPSLMRSFVTRSADDPERPEGVTANGARSRTTSFSRARERALDAGGLPRRRRSDAVRPLSGALAAVRPDDLAAVVLQAALERAAVPADAVDESIFGAANQAGEDNRNVARMAILLAGLPAEVPGYTVNRLCASGLQAIVSAAQQVRGGEADVVVAGGVESMTRAPMVLPKPGRAWGLVRGDGRLDPRVEARQPAHARARRR